MCKMCRKLEKNNIIDNNEMKKKKRHVKIEVVHNEKNVTFYTISFDEIDEML